MFMVLKQEMEKKPWFSMLKENKQSNREKEAKKHKKGTKQRHII